MTRDLRRRLEVDDDADMWGCGISDVRGEGKRAAVVVGLGCWAGLCRRGEGKARHGFGCLLSRVAGSAHGGEARGRAREPGLVVARCREEAGHGAGQAEEEREFEPESIFPFTNFLFFFSQKLN